MTRTITIVGKDEDISIAVSVKIKTQCRTNQEANALKESLTDMIHSGLKNVAGLHASEIEIKK